MFCKQVQTEGTLCTFECHCLCAFACACPLTFGVRLAADESAFGTRQDKLNGCVLQRRSWDDNARLLAPVFTAVSPPLPRAQRFRGEEGAAAKLSREGILLKKNQLQEHEHEAYARRAIEDAVTNDCF